MRPLLARIAWNHAIHAHLCSGSTSSYQDRLIQSFKPFAASSHQEVAQRLDTIRLPVDLALAAANDVNARTKVLVPDGDSDSMRYAWSRSEKPKKLQWMVTCGIGAAGVIFAFTGVALHHEDQPAKEMTALTGLPSSDGPPVPESSQENSRLDRLDKTWDKVVGPMLKSFAEICGVDRLKIHGWAIFDAITLQNDLPWNINRLLSPKYLTGEIFMEKSSDLITLLDDLDAESIRACEIPSWGQTWVANHLDQLLELFEDCLIGISGVNDPGSLKWVRDEHDNALIPLILSRVWANLIRALSSMRLLSCPKSYPESLLLVTRQLVRTYKRDPTTYVPTCLLDAEGRCTVDVDAIRLGLFTHLFDAAAAILGGDAIGVVRLPLTPSDEEENGDSYAAPVDAVIAHMAFGSDTFGQATMAGSLLGQLLHTQIFVLPLQSAARSSFKRLVGKILDAGSVQNCSGKLLGDMTNHMPWIFSDQEEIQLDVWRLLGELILILRAPAEIRSSHQMDGDDRPSAIFNSVEYQSHRRTPCEPALWALPRPQYRLHLASKCKPGRSRHMAGASESDDSAFQSEASGLQPRRARVACGTCQRFPGARRKDQVCESTTGDEAANEESAQQLSRCPVSHLLRRGSPSGPLNTTTHLISTSMKISSRSSSYCSSPMRY